MKDQPPDFDALWDYNDPAETERKFRELLPAAENSTNCGYLPELLTQIARTQGLQRKFEDGHATLDRVEAGLKPDMARPRIRYLLERGRVFNSSKLPDKARPLFLEAFELGKTAGEDALAVDAAHMMAIVEPPDKQIEWNLRAMKLAEESEEPRARKWLGSLYNNLGWTYHDLKQYDKALDLFRRGVRFRDEHKQAKELRIARWCVARCLRSLDRIGEALEMQNSLLKEHDQAKTTDGYVHEELAECLLLLHREAEAQPHFAKAYAELSTDSWLAENEADRLTRLKQLGEARS